MDLFSFIVGLVAGLSGYRLFIAYTIGRTLETRCDLCEFCQRKKPPC